MRLFLAMNMFLALQSFAQAQGCKGIPPGPQKMACIQKNPQLSSRLEACKNEGRQSGLKPGKSGGLPEFVKGCMQRGAK